MNAAVSVKSSCHGLQAFFDRMPSIREKRGSLGNVSGSPALHDAVAKGKDRLARFVLEAVDNEDIINSLDQHGKTPLIRSVKITDEEARSRVIRMLLNYGANVNAKDSMGRTPLSYACELQYSDVIKELVKNNADPNLDDNNGNTPLAYCALVGNEEGVHLLARSFRRLGLEVDKFNADGMTPLMTAAKNGHIDCARALAYEAKSSIYLQDKVRKMNSIDWAKEGGCKNAEMELLLPKRRSTRKTTQHLSLDKTQFKTFDDSLLDREFNKALSCDCFLPEITPDNSPLISHRGILQQNLGKLSKKLNSMKCSKSLSKLEQERPVSASIPVDKSSQSYLDQEYRSSKLSRSFDNVLDKEDSGSSSTRSLSPHPPHFTKHGGSPRMNRTYMSRSHETLSENKITREEQSSIKSSTNVKLAIMSGIVKMSNGHPRFLERQTAVDKSFTHLPPLLAANRKPSSQESR